MHRIAIGDGLRERFDFVDVHEYPNVLTNTILFVDHSKPHAGKALLQIRKHVGNGRTVGAYMSGAARVSA